MADDVTALMKYPGIKKADVMDYPLGSVALSLTVQPGVVKKLVLASGAFKRYVWHLEIATGIAQVQQPRADEADPDVPALWAYCSEAGRLAGAAHQGGHLQRKDYEWSKDVAAIKAPDVACVW